MQKNFQKAYKLAALFWVVIALSGCTLRARQLQNTVQPTDPASTVPVIMQPTYALTDVMEGIETVDPSKPDSAEPATIGVAPSNPGAESSDSQGQDLLEQITILDAANQAGDTLDDLP